MTDRNRFRSNKKYPTPPTVVDDVRNHTLALQAIIEGVNIGQRRAGDIRDSFVRLGELEDIGLIEIVGNGFNLVVSSGGGTSGAETDPVFLASPAYGIAAGDITNWDTAFGWGNHAAAGYLTSVTAADVDSGAAPDGYVMTADGAGAAAWEAPTGGAGGGYPPALGYAGI